MLFNLSPIFAYLDPGTGSFIIQMTVGAVVAAGAFIKIYWRKIKAFLTKGEDSKEA